MNEHPSVTVISLDLPVVSLTTPQAVHIKEVILLTCSNAYKGIYDVLPDTANYQIFFAFGEQQFRKALKENGLTEAQVVSAGNGMYGTIEAINGYFGEYEALDARVRQECDPQEVYDHELVLRNCKAAHSDYGAIKHIISLFGRERAKKVKRRFAKIEFEYIEEMIL